MDFDDEQRKKRHKRQRGEIVTRSFHVTNCIVRSDLSGGDVYCSHCNVRLTINREYFLVCPSCARVAEQTYDNFDYGDEPSAIHSYSNVGAYGNGCDSHSSVKFYERLFYLNEKVRDARHVDEGFNDTIHTQFPPG